MPAEAYPSQLSQYQPLGLENARVIIIGLFSKDEFDQIYAHLQRMNIYGHEIIIFTDKICFEKPASKINIITIPVVEKIFLPFIYDIIMELLVYHTSALKQSLRITH